MEIGTARGWPQSNTQDYSRDAAVGSTEKVQSNSTDPNLRNRNYAIIIKQDQDSKGSRPPRVVVGAVPQSLQIVQNVEWKAPWGAGLAGDGMVGDLLAATQGNRLVAQVLTLQVWQGSGNDFDFTVEFELRAWSDPIRDVIEPLRTLLRMSLPSVSESGFLESPGPILGTEGVSAISGQLTSVAANVVSAASSSISNPARTADGSTDYLASAKGVYDSVSQTVNKSGVARKSLIEPHLKNKISIQIGRWFYLNNVVVTQVTHNIKAQTPERDSGVIQAASVAISFKPVFSITAEDVDMMLRSGGAALALDN